MMRLNFMGTVIPTQAVVANMKKQKGGRIILCSSQVCHTSKIIVLTKRPLTSLAVKCQALNCAMCHSKCIWYRLLLHNPACQWFINKASLNFSYYNLFSRVFHKLNLPHSYSVIWLPRQDRLVCLDTPLTQLVNMLWGALLKLCN